MGIARGIVLRKKRTLAPLGTQLDNAPLFKRARTFDIRTQSSIGTTLVTGGQAAGVGKQPAHTQGKMSGQKPRQGNGRKGGSSVGSRAKQPKLDLHKRGLPVAWGSDIFAKCPRLAERFSVFSQPRPPERGPHELG